MGSRGPLDRSKLSSKRRTIDYIRYRKKFRKNQKAARQGAKADKDHTYKGDTGGGRAAAEGANDGDEGTNRENISPESLL